MPRSSPQTERLVHVLELLSTSGRSGRTLAELARSLGVDKATCLPMLRELTRVGWLVRNPRDKTFHLGPRLVAIGRAAEHAVDAVDVARRELADLADRTGLACLAVTASDEELVVADVVQPAASTRRTQRALGLRAGDRIAFRPPLGAVLAAWSTPETEQRWLDRGSNTGDEAAARRRAILRIVRERGFAVEEFRPRPRELGELIEHTAGARHGAQRASAIFADQIRHLGEDVMLGRLDPEADYWPVSINAPVLDDNSLATLALCVIDPEGPLSGRRVAELGSSVAAAARLVAGQLGAKAG